MQRITALAIALASSSTAHAQSTFRIEKTPLPSTYKLKWNSVNGRTYFIQQSSNLVNWSYIPEVIPGVGGEDWMGIASIAEKGFFRAVSTNIPTVNVLTADHDGDGVPSYAELTVTHTDPLKFSTAGNGISDRTLFPNPAGGIYIDSVNGVQYVIVPNSAGVTGAPKILPTHYFDTPDYAIEHKKGNLSLNKHGFLPFGSTNPNATPVRYLALEKAVSIWDWSYVRIPGEDWIAGYSADSPVRKVIGATYADSYEAYDTNPLTGAVVRSGGTLPAYISSTAIPTTVFEFTDPEYRYQRIIAPNWQYDIPPYNNNPVWGFWDAACRPFYEEGVFEENTLQKVGDTAKANRPAYPAIWTEGNPWALWDNWGNQLGLTYSRVKFRIKNKNGVTNGEPAQVAVYFDPEDGSARQEVNRFTWNGTGIYSPEYEIDPATLKPGIEGTFHLNAGSMFFELDLAQADERRANQTVLIPVADDEPSGLLRSSTSSPQALEPAPGHTPIVAPDIRFPGMDDNWYEGATVTLSQTSGSGSVSLRAVNDLTGHEVEVPFDQNLAPDYFHSSGDYSNYKWALRGIDAGTIALRLTYSKGTTNLTLDRTAYVSPKVNLYPQTIPLDGLTRAKIKLSNLGVTAVPTLSANQMPLITIAGAAATGVRQDEFDPTTFYFTPPTSATHGAAQVKISGITIGGFTFTAGATTLQPYQDWVYIDNLEQGIPSFSGSIGICIEESRSSAMSAKALGLNSEDAADKFMSSMNTFANEGMGIVKLFVADKPIGNEDELEFDYLIQDNNLRTDEALGAIFGGTIPPVTPSTIPISTSSGTPQFGSATFFPDVRSWMNTTGNRIFTGSYDGDKVGYAVIEANEFDLSTWTTTTVNHNIYNAKLANPKARILINGALFNYKDESFVTTGIVYKDGLQLPTSTDPSKRSNTVALLRYWLGQTTDNSMTANGTSGATYQFGGKGHPPVPAAPPAATDVHASIGGMISCIWPDAGGVGKKTTAAVDSDLKVYEGFQGSWYGFGIIGIDRATGLIIILSKNHRTSLSFFDVQNHLWVSGVDQAATTDGGSSVALYIDGSVPVKGGRHYGKSTARDTVTNYFTFTPIPVATITAPLPGASLTVGTPVTISASAKGGSGAITKVEFYQGATKLGESTAPPFSITFTPTAPGAATFHAKVFDSDGGAAESLTVPVTLTP